MYPQFVFLHVMATHIRDSSFQSSRLSPTRFPSGYHLESATLLLGDYMFCHFVCKTYEMGNAAHPKLPISLRTPSFYTHPAVPRAATATFCTRFAPNGCMHASMSIYLAQRGEAQMAKVLGLSECEKHLELHMFSSLHRECRPWTGGIGAH